MPEMTDFHMKFGRFHTTLLRKLKERTGLSRQELFKWALYRLAVEEKIIPVPELGEDVRRDFVGHPSTKDADD